MGDLEVGEVSDFIREGLQLVLGKKEALEFREDVDSSRQRW